MPSLPISHFLMACANSGLFPRSSFFRGDLEQVSFAAALRTRFTERSYRVRHPSIADLPELIELDEACWSETLRTPVEQLRERLETFPSGHCVLEWEGRLAGALYSQRIAGMAALTGMTDRNASSLHRDDGPVVQLLSVNVLPQMQNLGLGDQLLEFMLQYCSVCQGVERIIAISLCREYGDHQAIPLAEYIDLRDKDGNLVEPILRFHEAHGGRITGLVPGYRPRDKNNRGQGVLVEYEIDNRQSQKSRARGVSSEANRRGSRNGPVLPLVEECVRRVMSEGSTFSPDRPLMEMGLDSLRLMELRSLLGEKLDCELATAFFFRYSSPEKIARFFEQGKTGEEEAKEPVERRLFTEGEWGEQMPEAALEEASLSEHAGDSATLSGAVPEQALAVVGMACRLPGNVKTPEEFWSLLSEGIDAIGDVPASRWDGGRCCDGDREKPGTIASRQGGFLGDVQRFDAAFFHVSAREAAAMDPQQRLLLEVAWEALENGGINPLSLAGTSAGIFVGISSHDYEILQLRSGVDENLDSHFATGNANSMAAGRLAYFFGVQGPALAVDTACSSSLVALHLACQSLRKREASLAIVAGVNLLLAPEMSVSFSRAGMLSPAGRCKTFDVEADGYVRSEGCGVVVLKLLSRAIDDGDRILALVKGTAINQDGASNGLTAPNGLAQREVIEKALADAGAAPRDVSHVEAHGTGTALGDPVEVEALSQVYGRGRQPDNPLILGSVKTNLGHLEAAAGIAGLIKVVLSLRQARIPGLLHFRKLNPLVTLDASPVLIPTGQIAWRSAGGKRLLAGVSSFGFSGTNAHAIIEEAPVPEEISRKGRERPLHIMTLSARSEEALNQLVNRYEHFFATLPAASLADAAYTANAGRAHFSHRLSIIAGSPGEMKEKLCTSVISGTGIIRHSPSALPKTAFLFTGQGAQFAGMGRELYHTQPTFRKALDRCAAVLKDCLDLPLLEIIYPRDGEEGAEIDKTAHTQPALFAFEYALCELWKSWGVEPGAVMGHSVGEYAAACRAGVFSLEEGLRLIAERGRLMQALPGNGSMAAVFAEEATVLEAIRPYRGTLALAAVNGPRLTVVSGPMGQVATIMERFRKEGVTVTRLNVSHAFHSPLMAPMLVPFGEVAARIAYSPPRLDLIGNLAGEITGAEIASPGYWIQHAREPVRFRDGMEALYRRGYRMFIEIGPQPVLLGMGKRCLPQGDCVWLPSLRRGVSDWEQMLLSLGELYVQGGKVDWQGFDRDYQRRKISLPTYPFQGEAHWIKNGGSRIDSERQPRGSQEEESAFPGLLYQIAWYQKPLPERGEPVNFPHPGEISEGLLALAEEKNPGWPELLAGMERLSVSCCLAALQQMGWNFAGSGSFLADEMAGTLGVTAKYQPLLLRLLGMLAEEGILRRDEEGDGRTWTKGISPDDGNYFNDPEGQLEELFSRYPRAATELTILGRCGAGIAGVLREEVEPLDLLFPQADLTTATRLYEDSLAFGGMNEVMGAVLPRLLEGATGARKIRILELGAGTGGTTAAILPCLRGKNVEYVFTDVSPLFLLRGKERFPGDSPLSYQLLDIERDPLAQGFKTGEFDIILAANVLHATEDLRRTLNHVRSLLAAGGMMVLLEGTKKRRWLDMIFGLHDGWWKFRDHDLRPSHPLLAASAWESLLQESGFSETSVIEPERRGRLFEQAVIISRAPDRSEQIPVGEPGQWLILAGSAGTGNRLSRLLRDRKDLVALVSPGASFVRLSADEFSLDPAERQDYVRLLRELASDRRAVTGIIDLRGLDARDAGGGAGETALRLCRDFLALVQALIKSTAPPPSLWLVTGNAVSLDGTERLLKGLPQASLRGMAQVVRAEHPEFNCITIDLAEGPDREDELFREIIGGTGEIQTALRRDTRYAARLVPCKDRVPACQQIRTLNPEGAYLITGALGGIGLQVARQLVQDGARHLVLVSRRGEPAVTDPAAGVLRELEEKGAELILVPVDVAKRAELQALRERLNQSSRPLKGVIHAAGVFEDRLLADHEVDVFSRVFAAKVTGAWNLHELTRDLPLDFFILLSSATTVVCSAGLGNYVAANAFLDALAHYRRSIGLPGISIAWGPWAGTGMAGSIAPTRLSQWANQGLGMIPPGQALTLLRQLRCSTLPQVVVMAMDWQRYFSQSSPGMRSAQFELIPASREGRREQNRNLREELAALSGGRRRDHLQSYLCDLVARILGLESAAAVERGKGFFQLGMDSLTSMELRNRLQKEFSCSLATTLVFKYPTVVSLADYLLDEVCEPAGKEDSKIGAGKNREDDRSNQDLELLSEEQAEALLLKKLERLNF